MIYEPITQEQLGCAVPMEDWLKFIKVMQEYEWESVVYEAGTPFDSVELKHIQAVRAASLHSLKNVLHAYQIDRLILHYKRQCINVPKQISHPKH